MFLGARRRRASAQRQEWADGSSVLVLSEGLWYSAFGGDPGVIGRPVSVDGHPYLVAAVLPESIAYPPDVEAWRPMRLEERTDDDPEHAVLARLAPGVTHDRAEEEARAITRSYLEGGGNELAGLNVRIADARDSMVHSARGPLLMIQGAAAAILLVMCLNLANLLHARGETRRSEFAVRAALGAERRRLLAGVITEAGLLMAVGYGAGLLGATLALPGLRALLPEAVPSLHQIEINGRVLGVTLIVSFATFIAFSAWPALQASSAPPRAALARGESPRGKERGWAPRMLVSGQIAVSTMLVMAAILLTTSFVRLSQVDRGFDDSALLYLPAPHLVAGGGEGAAYVSALLEVVNGTPGVDSAALTTHPPTSARSLNFGLSGLQGLTISPNERQTRGGVVVVSRGYVETAGLALIRGRTFNAADRDDSEPVAVVSESFARTHLPDRKALSAVFHRASFEDGEPVATRIVGIVEDTRPFPGDPAPEMLYLPWSQVGFVPGVLARATGDPRATAAAIRRRLRTFDPTLPTNRLTLLAPPERLTSTRFQAWTVGLFAGLALLLAIVGLYGISAHAVARRRREIGIRCALGATDRSVQLGVLRGATVIAGIGCSAGLLGSVLMSSLLRGLLFGVDPLAPAVFGAAVVLLAGASLVAAWLPARRAASVDPITALRAE